MPGMCVNAGGSHTEEAFLLPQSCQNSKIFFFNFYAIRRKSSNISELIYLFSVTTSDLEPD